MVRDNTQRMLPILYTFGSHDRLPLKMLFAFAVLFVIYIMELTNACLPFSYFQFIIFTRKYFPSSQSCILLLAVSKESHVMPAKLTKVPMSGLM
jgi:hypothetical protein